MRGACGLAPAALRVRASRTCGVRHVDGALSACVADGVFLINGPVTSRVGVGEVGRLLVGAAGSRQSTSIVDAPARVGNARTSAQSRQTRRCLLSENNRNFYSQAVAATKPQGMGTPKAATCPVATAIDDHGVCPDQWEQAAAEQRRDHRRQAGPHGVHSRHWNAVELRTQPSGRVGGRRTGDWSKPGRSRETSII